MTITIITLFPKVFEPIFTSSIIGRAQKNGKIKIQTLDLRQFGIGRHQQVDDTPYGGGVGMLLRVDVVDLAIQGARIKGKKEAVILVDPKGTPFKQELAENLAHDFDHLILVCGHYEGFDDRIRSLVDYEISLGDYVLSGGEIGAMAIAETIARLVPGVLQQDATNLESFSKESNRILEHPHYTKPAEYKGEKVPEILLSGNFKKIEEWRKNEAQKLTKKRRPDIKI